MVDVPDEYVGAVTQAAAPRKGTIVELSPGDPGRSIVTIVAPARGLLGFRSLLMTTTRGTALSTSTTTDGCHGWASCPTA